MFDGLMPLHHVVIFVQKDKDDVCEEEHWVLEAEDERVVVAFFIPTVGDLVIENSPEEQWKVDHV